MACRVNSEHSKTKSKKLLVRECIQYFIQCEEHVLDLASASSLVDLLKALAHHTEGGQSKVNDIGKLSTSCNTFFLFNTKKKPGSSLGVLVLSVVHGERPQ